MPLSRQKQCLSNHDHRRNLTILGMMRWNCEPAPEKAGACSNPLAAGSKPHQFYKCLLNQHAQKLRKPLPAYQVHNEGSEHQPKFRSTITFDGKSYKSSNTYLHRKMADMDVSKVAYLAIIQNSKNEAAQIIQEDTTFCKAVLVEYATKMNLEKPEYETTQVLMTQSEIPAYSSSVFFNGVTYKGDISKSKKEAEQMAARAVIMKILDTEKGKDMVEMINCKSRHFSETNKVQEIRNVDNRTTFVGAQSGIHNESATNGNTSQAHEHVLVTCQISERKRNKRNKKKVNKKMRLDPQVPIAAVPVSQANEWEGSWW